MNKRPHHKWPQSNLNITSMQNVNTTAEKNDSKCVFVCSEGEAHYTPRLPYSVFVTLTLMFVTLTLQYKTTIQSNLTNQVQF